MVGLNLWKQVQSLQCRIPYEGTCFAGYKRISLARERERVGWIYIYASRPHSLHISRRSRVCVCCRVLGVWKEFLNWAPACAVQLVPLVICLMFSRFFKLEGEEEIK